MGFLKKAFKVFRKLQDLDPVAKYVHGMQRAQKDAKNQARAQTASYEQQAGIARDQQARMNASIAESAAKRNAGIARANRSRGRGGIFGDDEQRGGGQGPIGPRLG